MDSVELPVAPARPACADSVRFSGGSFRGHESHNSIFIRCLCVFLPRRGRRNPHTGICRPCETRILRQFACFPTGYSPRTPCPAPLGDGVSAYRPGRGILDSSVTRRGPAPPGPSRRPRDSSMARVSRRERRERRELRNSFSKNALHRIKPPGTAQESPRVATRGALQTLAYKTLAYPPAASARQSVVFVFSVSSPRDLPIPSSPRSPRPLREPPDSAVPPDPDVYRRPDPVARRTIVS